MALQTRKPTGAVPWPLIVLSGEEKSGKSWAAAVLSSSPKVGPTYWIDLGEGAADEYGAIPGVRYEIVEHDGTFSSLLHAVEEVHALAVAAAKTGAPPVVLVLDSGTGEWDLLKDWATQRARRSAANKAKLARDPNAEIVVSTNYWNDANTRHRKLMKLLMTFPGIAVVTARGKWVAVMDSNGQPVEGQKEYRVEGQKGLAFDASCWVRLSRDEPGVVVGARSVHTGIRPGRDAPQELPDGWTLEWLVFDALKCDPANAHARDLVDAKHERSPEEILAEALNPATSFERLGELNREVADLGYESVIGSNEHGHDELILNVIRRQGQLRKAQPRSDGPATDQQHRHMHALWHETGEFEDRDDRIKFTSEIIRRGIASSRELTGAEADAVIDHLKRYTQRLREQADEAATS